MRGHRLGASRQKEKSSVVMWLPSSLGVDSSLYGLRPAPGMIVVTSVRRNLTNYYVFS